MGCEQSSVKKTASPKWSSKVLPRNAQIDEEYRKEYNNSYQDLLLDGQTKPSMEDSAKAEKLLQEYFKTEEKISILEQGDPLTVFYIKKSHMEKVEAAIKTQLETTEAIKKRQTESDRNNSGKKPNTMTVKSILVEMGDKRLGKDEQEFLAGINKLEIALTELEMLHQEKAMTESDINDLQDVLSELKDTYEQQDDILDQLSLLEPSQKEVESQEGLVDLETRRLQLSDINERWKESRALVGEASRQFSMALDKWKNIKDDNPANLYDQGEEIRDDLVTAMQCLTNSKFYIPVNFPYCSKVEIAILEKAMTYLFIDMKTDERRLHAESCYNAFQKRTIALYAWMDMTIHAMIEPDLKSTTYEINERIKKLREIRKKHFESKYPDEESQKILNELDISQLAPLPSREEIFGKPSDLLVLENYKSRLRESISISKHLERNNSLDQAIDEIIWSRKPSIQTLSNGLGTEIKDLAT